MLRSNRLPSPPDFQPDRMFLLWILPPPVPLALAPNPDLDLNRDLNLNLSDSSSGVGEGAPYKRSWCSHSSGASSGSGSAGRYQ
jgi:hypothetical protein